MISLRQQYYLFKKNKWIENKFMNKYFLYSLIYIIFTYLLGVFSYLKMFIIK